MPNIPRNPKNFNKKKYDIILCYIVFNILPVEISIKGYKATSDDYIRLIPQGTVDNNLGPDCLAGPKALDPNYCRQPTL